jgi:hypothetical protein
MFKSSLDSIKIIHFLLSLNKIGTDFIIMTTGSENSFTIGTVAELATVQLQSGQCPGVFLNVGGLL